MNPNDNRGQRPAFPDAGTGLGPAETNLKENRTSHLAAYPFAGFWMRFWAYLLDLLIIQSVNWLILHPVFRLLKLSLADDSMFSPISILSAAVFYLYFILMTKYFSQTLGKMVFGLKVVPVHPGRQLTWSTILFREWIGRYLSATLMLLYIVVAFTPKKQGIHDLFADTAVIIERPQQPVYTNPNPEPAS